MMFKNRLKLRSNPKEKEIKTMIVQYGYQTFYFTMSIKMNMLKKNLDVLAMSS